MRKIIKIEPTVPTLPKRKRVAAYARVSMETERLMHSLSAQISYYSELIQKNPEWEYAGVYADSFVSGTDTVKRKEFQRLIADCDAGRIDIVLCKSISRFARNTVDLLKTVRHLKNLGIEVRFERENINSLSGDGELMLTILASFAEQESISLSENLKWAIQKKFERGEPWGQACYGYTKVGNEYIVNDEEAVFIRKIYADFLEDVPMSRTAEWLGKNGCRCTTKQFVKSVLTNVTYTGDLILQKHFSPKVRNIQKNSGEIPKFHVHGHHPAIISIEIFERVQQKMQSMLAYNPEAHRVGRVKCFSSKITCAVCGNHYVRYSNCGWACFGKIKSRKRICQNGNLSIDLLENLCTEVMGDFSEDIFASTVHNLLVCPDGRVIFSFYDGSIKEGNDENVCLKAMKKENSGFLYTGSTYYVSNYMQCFTVCKNKCFNYADLKNKLDPQLTYPISFKSNETNYLSAYVSKKDSPIQSTSNNDTWEAMRIYRKGNNEYIQSMQNGFFIQIQDDGKAYANGKLPSTWETFDVK